MNPETGELSAEQKPGMVRLPRRLRRHAEGKDSVDLTADGPLQRFAAKARAKKRRKAARASRKRNRHDRT